MSVFPSPPAFPAPVHALTETRSTHLVTVDKHIVLLKGQLLPVALLCLSKAPEFSFTTQVTTWVTVTGTLCIQLCTAPACPLIDKGLQGGPLAGEARTSQMSQTAGGRQTPPTQVQVGTIC